MAPEIRPPEWGASGVFTPMLRFSHPELHPSAAGEITYAPPPGITAHAGPVCGDPEQDLRTLEVRP